MHHRNKHPIEPLFIDVIIPTILTGYFIHYTLTGEYVVKSSDNMIFIMLQLILAIFVAPVLLIFDLTFYFTGWKPEPGSDIWQVKLFSKSLYLLFFVILIFQWLG